MKGIYNLSILVTTLVLLFTSTSWAAENPKERIDYWQKNFEELKPEQDPRANSAHEIFNRLLNAAGKRAGVIPRLFIVKSDSPYIPLAFAIPDGGIIISKKVLDICYKSPERGHDRLAFILAHEIAHQIKDDFWHMKFFEAVDLSKEKNAQQNEVLKEVQAIAGMTDKVLAKELQADEYGIIYAAMGGFNTNAIVTEDDQMNFFEYFYQSMDPGNIKGIQRDSTHPTPKQRAETVRARLKQVLEKVELFNLGVMFYQVGDFQKAILFFSEFLKFFPSREVYHNLASSYHQLALKYYKEWKGEDQSSPFKLSLSIDPETRASKITLRSAKQKSPEELFKTHIEKAIEFYNTAISHDPSYILSYNNLACALITKGEKGDVYKAIGLLEDTMKIKPNPWEKEVLNNLGIAFYYAKNLGEAKEYLLKAHQLDPKYDAPLFNLGKLCIEAGKQVEGKEFWLAYLKLDSVSLWANFIHKSLSLEIRKLAPTSQKTKEVEKILDLEIGVYDDEVPKEWGKPITKEIALEVEPYLLNTYPNGVMTLSQEKEIKLIVTLDGFSGKTQKGIGIGTYQKEVFSRYGIPTKILEMTQGTSWIYEFRGNGIVFKLRENKIVSWLLF